MLQRALMLALPVAAALTVAGVEWFGTGTGRGTTRPPSVAPGAVTVHSSPRPVVPAVSNSRGIEPLIRRDAMDAQTLASLGALTGVEPTSSELALLAGIALSHPQPAVREEAQHLLGEAGGEIALQCLQQAVRDPSLRVRRSAIRALARIGGWGAEQALAEALNAPETAMRLEAIDALSSMNPRAALPMLEAALQDESEVVREAAADWLEEVPR